MLWRRSAAITKSRGDSGSPCLTPLLQWKSFPGKPLSRIEDVPELKIWEIQVHHLSRKPLACKTFSMDLCSTMSKAFSKSNLRMTISLLEVWHWHKYLNAHPKQSGIVLPCINPYWFLCITCKIAFYNLLERILARNFMVEFNREIGLKYVTFSRLVFLGTRAI
jgi:hypothetical protein